MEIHADTVIQFISRKHRQFYFLKGFLRQNIKCLAVQLHLLFKAEALCSLTFVSWEEDKMAAIIVNLECMTNMHVGNGDVNYNIIDNEVEKDPVTGYPTINASGVKGALREFFNGDSC